MSGQKTVVKCDTSFNCIYYTHVYANLHTGSVIDFIFFFFHLWYGYAIIFRVFTNIYRLKDTFC